MAQGGVLHHYRWYRKVKSKVVLNKQSTGRWGGLYAEGDTLVFHWQVARDG